MFCPLDRCVELILVSVSNQLFEVYNIIILHNLWTYTYMTIQCIYTDTQHKVYLHSLWPQKILSNCFKISKTSALGAGNNARVIRESVGSM